MRSQAKFFFLDPGAIFFWRPKKKSGRIFNSSECEHLLFFEKKILVLQKWDTEMKVHFPGDSKSPFWDG